MFGTYRLILACMVVLQHLSGYEDLGAYAVFGFYALSGYLMTLVLNQKYGYTLKGRLSYAYNRFLRIFPLYWVSTIMAAIAIYHIGSKESAGYFPSLFLSGEPSSLIQHLTIFFTRNSMPRLIPPAWALTVELAFYVLIGAGLSRTPGRARLWFVASVVYTVVVNIAATPWTYKYFLLPAASLPFSAGALLFHERERLRTFKVLTAWYTPIFLGALIVINYRISLQLDILRSYGFYLNFILNLGCILTLSYSSARSRLGKFLDKHLGDLSYPVYLNHYTVGLALFALLAVPKHSSTLIPLLSTLVFAAFLSICFDRPLAKLRLPALPFSKIRSSEATPALAPVTPELCGSPAKHS